MGYRSYYMITLFHLNFALRNITIGPLILKNVHTGDYVLLLSGPKLGKFGKFGNHYIDPHKILEVLNKTKLVCAEKRKHTAR